MDKLNFFEMQAIAGGVCAKEYCAELSAIMGANWNSMTESEKKAAAQSYAKYC